MTSESPLPARRPPPCVPGAGSHVPAGGLTPWGAAPRYAGLPPCSPAGPFRSPRDGRAARPRGGGRRATGAHPELRPQGPRRRPALRPHSPAPCVKAFDGPWVGFRGDSSRRSRTVETPLGDAPVCCVPVTCNVLGSLGHRGSAASHAVRLAAAIEQHEQRAHRLGREQREDP